MRYYTNGNVRRIDFGAFGHIGIAPLSRYGFDKAKGWKLFCSGGRRLSCVPSMGFGVHTWEIGIGWSGSRNKPRSHCYVKVGLFSMHFDVPEFAQLYLSLRATKKFEEEMSRIYSDDPLTWEEDEFIEDVRSFEEDCGGY